MTGRTVGLKAAIIKSFNKTLVFIYFACMQSTVLGVCLLLTLRVFLHAALWTGRVTHVFSFFVLQYNKQKQTKHTKASLADMKNNITD